MQVQHIDTCLGSFLLDHHNRDCELLLGVTVTGESTIGDVLHDLALELNEVCLEEGERGGFRYDDASRAIADLKSENSAKLGNLFDSSLENPSDEEFNMEEQVQAWFLFTWEAKEGPIETA